MIATFWKRILMIVSLISILTCSRKNINNPNNGLSNTQHVSVVTQHNDNTRAGWNSHENILTTSNVNFQHFGKLFTLSVDDQVYAQPLVVGNLSINGTKHNVVYVATVNNTVYAFDGDNGQLYWEKNYTASGMRPPRNTDMTGACGGGYQDFSGNIGIVGTPVIDTVAQTIFFVTRSTNGSGLFYQHLHAVNIINGNELSGSPVEITATYSGNGDGSVGNVITFDPQKQNQRQALTLVNGIVYVSFSSHCDWGPYHGWILGYDAATLQQKIVYNNTPNGYNGGIWESGMGMAADNQGNLYCVTGNGSVGYNSDPTSLINRGESALKLIPFGSTLQVSSYFTPDNYPFLESNDLDYGGLGSFLMPNTSLFFTGCKDGNIYLLNKDNMGGYSSGANQVQQTIFLGSNANMHCQPSYYRGSSNEFVYIWPENSSLHAIPFNRSTNLFDPTQQVLFSSNGPIGQNGAVLSVSSNDTISGTAILWASHAVSPYDAEHTVSPGVLRAFDANNISVELWNSSQNITQDGPGNYAKFSSPTIANGHVYLPTFSHQVVVYGLK